MDKKTHKVLGVIFDFDGTLVLTEHIHMDAWEDVARSLERSLPDGFRHDSVGWSDQLVVKSLKLHWNSSFSEVELLQKKRDFYKNRVTSGCEEVPGSINMIRLIFESKRKIALATNSPRTEIEPILNFLNIRSYFHQIWTVDDVQAPKPDPEIYLKASNSLGLKPEECLVFEDSVAGATSARAAGCKLMTLQTAFSADKLGESLLSIKDFQDQRLIEWMESFLSNVF